MKPLTKRRGGAAAAALVLVLGWGWLATDSVRASDSDDGYVGAEVCGTCHREQLKLWRGSHHDRAMELATEQTVLGNFADSSFTSRGVTSRFYRKDGKYFVHTQGADGNPGDFEARYTFGFQPLQQYLLDVGNGRLQAFSVAWDTRPADAGGQRWFDLQTEDDVGPGDPLHWTGPLYNWNARCAACHSTNLRKNFDLAGRSYATTWSEIDVGCEACHGAGADHTAWAAQGRDPAKANGLRVAFDTPRAEIEACAPCHSRRHVIAEPAPPGAPYLDHYVVQLLRRDLYFADGQIDDEVYVYGSFLQSKMHAAGVRCGNCHDPHSGRRLADGDALCVQCHGPGGNKAFPTVRSGNYADDTHHHHPPAGDGARCVNCHMPERTYMVLDGRRDHSFRLPRPDLSVAYDVPNACNGCHADRKPQWAADAIEQWFGPKRDPHWTAALALGRRDAAEALPLLEDLARDTSRPAIVRATAIELLTNFGPSGTSTALAQARDESALVRMAAAAALDTLPVATRLAGVALLSDPVRAVRIEAARPFATVPADQLDAAQAKARSDALDEYRAAQRINLDTPEAHLNLGVLHVAAGELAQAQSEYETAIAIGPYFTPAYVNLADLHRMTGREKESEETLRRALAVDPRSAAALHALGLSLVRQRRTAEGVAALARAAELAPETPRYAYAYGIALYSTGKPDRAIAVLQQAYEHHTADIEILSALVGFHRERGQAGDALLFARKLQQLVPNDPNLKALVSTLEAEAAAKTN